MALGNGFSTGFNNVPAYQISGIPFFTTVLVPKDTDVHVKFPFITNFIHIFTDSTNAAHRVKVGFSPNSIANGRYFETNRLIMPSKQPIIKNTFVPIRITVLKFMYGPAFHYTRIIVKLHTYDLDVRIVERVKIWVEMIEPEGELETRCK